MVDMIGDRFRRALFDDALQVGFEMTTRVNNARFDQVLRRIDTLKPESG